jgi:hypothetical protein
MLFILTNFFNLKIIGPLPPPPPPAKALVQRGDSLIKPRQTQNRISGFSTESVLKTSVLKPLILFCDWRGLIKESPR